MLFECSVLCVNSFLTILAILHYAVDVESTQGIRTAGRNYQLDIFQYLRLLYNDLQSKSSTD